MNAGAVRATRARLQLHSQSLLALSHDRIYAIQNPPTSRASLQWHAPSRTKAGISSFAAGEQGESLHELSSTLRKLGLAQIPQHPNASVATNPVDLYRAHITEQLAPITATDPSLIYNSLQWTQTLAKGDLVLPVPALGLKALKRNAVAEDIVRKFPDSPLVEKPQTDGVTVRFFFKTAPLTSVVLPCIMRQGASYGFDEKTGLRDAANPEQGRKKIIVEFSSPNIAKPFHAGHLRSTIIGGFLSNLYTAAGWDVVRMNYLGDWGKQYGVLAIGFRKFGSEHALLQNPIGHLYDVYVNISKIARDEEDQMKQLKEDIDDRRAKNESFQEEEVELRRLEEEGVDQKARDYFKRMVDGDEEALELWKRFRALSIDKYRETYARLNIQYDDYSGESQVRNDSVESAARMMAGKDVSEDFQGAVIVDFTKCRDKESKKLGKAFVKKKDGTSLYLTRDIGTAFERFETYRFDKMIYVVADPQKVHLKQLFKIIALIGREDIAEKCQHITFGMVRGMSTRKGTAKFLDDILRDVGAKMHDVMKSNEAKYVQVEDPEKTADTLGISAVMVQDMTGKRINEYTFNMDRMTSFEGDTGPYLQYAHARLCSILRKADLDGSEIKSADFSLLEEQHAVNLTRTLAQWPDVFQNTLKTLEPVTVLTYLFKMGHSLSSSYDHLQVIGSEPSLKRARLALYWCARQVLGNECKFIATLDC